MKKRFRIASAALLIMISVFDGAVLTFRADADVSTTTANRMVVWTSASSLISMTDAQLHTLQQDGVGGFVGGVQWLTGMGGSQVLTANGTGPANGVESRLASSNIVARAHALGMKVYLGFNLDNYSNNQTPLGEWFNDGEWSNVVVPAVQGAAGAAQELGFDGIAMDGELYAHNGATWDWDYPGNTHTQAQVRAEVTARGQQLMTAILAAFPSVQIADYDASFPDTWDEYARAHNGAGTFASNVDINFWDGMTSVDGYSAIRFYDETFYKDTGYGNGTADSWASALDYETNSAMALFSTQFSNWAYAADRVSVTPSAWIDGDVANEGPGASPRSPAYVATQLQAFRNWGMDGEFADFAYAPLSQFNYAPYASAMQAAATPGTVNDPAPTITVTSVNTSNGEATITGSATDSYAVRDVTWSSSTGASGAAPMVWNITGGSYATGYTSESDWTINLTVLPTPTTVLVTAENIHGATSTTTINVPGTAPAIAIPPTTINVPVTAPAVVTPPTTIATPTTTTTIPAGCPG